MTIDDRHASDDGAFLEAYFGRLHEAVAISEERFAAIIAIRDRWRETARTGNKVMFIGNGGSAAMASHLAIDLAKNGGIPAVAFNDAATLTCLANDYGYEEMFRHAVRLWGHNGDTLVAISTSGTSKNVLNGVAQAKEMGITVVTTTGKSPDNPLRAMGDINLWIGSDAYNIVETVHQFWLLAALDLAIGRAEYAADKVVDKRPLDKR